MHVYMPTEHVCVRKCVCAGIVKWDVEKEPPLSAQTPDPTSERRKKREMLRGGERESERERARELCCKVTNASTFLLPKRVQHPCVNHQDLTQTNTHIDTKSAEDRSPLPGVSKSESSVSFWERHLSVPPHHDLCPLMTPLDPPNLVQTVTFLPPATTLVWDSHTWTEYLHGDSPSTGTDSRANQLQITGSYVYCGLSVRWQTGIRSFTVRFNKQNT